MSGFTAQAMRWRPFVTPARMDDLSDAQRAALQDTPSGTKVSDYLLVLAHDPQVLAERTPIYNAIMYGEGGLPNAERELAAMGASIVNGCRYCFSVHARRFKSLSGRDDLLDEVLTQGPGAPLEPRLRAVFSFAMKLTREPAAIGEADIQALAQAGLSPLDMVDLVLSAGVFSWANRLMHSLGEAELPAPRA